MKKKIFSFDNHLHLCTGAHKVLADIHNAVKDDFDAKVLGTLEYKDVNPALGIQENEYSKYRSIFELKNSILVVHQRRLAIYFYLLTKLLFLNTKVVYIHHSILKGYKHLSILPDHIVTISDRCIENLVNYFGIPKRNVTKIHNAVVDCYGGNISKVDKKHIKILYPATVNSIKRQLLIVENLKSVLHDNIEILFAGEGEDYEKLCEITEGDKRFICLGFVNNITELMQNVNYVMLFSEHEGLPISLIEASMMSLPIICNDVGGNLEIAHDNYNAYVCNTWEKLVETLNNLENISEVCYYNLSNNSRTVYLNNFTFDNFKKKYISYFSKL